MEHGLELGAVRAELQRLANSVKEVNTALLPPPPLEGGHDLTERVHSLAVHVSWVVRGAVHQGPAPP